VYFLRDSSEAIPTKCSFFVRDIETSLFRKVDSAVSGAIDSWQI